MINVAFFQSEFGVSAGTTTIVYVNGKTTGDLKSPLVTSAPLCTDPGISWVASKAVKVTNPATLASTGNVTFTLQGNSNATTTNKYIKVYTIMYYSTTTTSTYNYQFGAVQYVCGYTGKPTCDADMKVIYANLGNKPVYRLQVNSERIVNGVTQTETRFYKFKDTSASGNCPVTSSTSTATPTATSTATSTATTTATTEVKVGTPTITSGLPLALDTGLTNDVDGNPGGYQAIFTYYKSTYKGPVGLQCARLTPTGAYAHSVCTGAATYYSCKNNPSDPNEVPFKVNDCAVTSYGGDPAVDLSATCNTKVYSWYDGKVIYMQMDATGARVVKVQHSAIPFTLNGVTTNRTVVSVYYHLNGFAAGLAVGSVVTKGQLVGYVGDSGTGAGNRPDCMIDANKNGKPDNASAAHLHFMIQVDGVYKDPCEGYISCSSYMTLNNFYYPFWVPKNFPWSKVGASVPVIPIGQQGYPVYCFTPITGAFLPRATCTIQ